MFKPKVLVVSPTYSGSKRYLHSWLDGIQQQTYTNYDILFCDNSNDEGVYAEELSQYGIVIKSTPNPNIHLALVEAYNKIRDYFLVNQYDLMWIVESDQVPPPEALEELIKADKPVIGCPYFLNKNNDVVCVHTPDTLQIYNWSDLQLRIDKENKTILHVGGVGHGAVLAKRDVIQKISFRIDEKNKLSASPDTFWYIDLKQHNIPVYCLTSCFSEHLRITNSQQEYPEGIQTIKLDDFIVVKCKGDFWGNGLPGSRGRFIIGKGQKKLLPKTIDIITYNALQSGLLIKIDPVADDKAKQLLEEKLKEEKLKYKKK